MRHKIIGISGSPMGAAAVASIHGAGKFDPSIRTGTREDEAGLKIADAVISSVSELSELIHK